MQPNPCSKDPARVNENGRAFAGSQRWIQYYVNYGQNDLNDAIIQSQDSLRGSHALQWVSPLESDGFTEYRDETFLACLGFPHLGAQYSACWPRNGPCWDALAVVRRNGENGVLLVEAKSYPDEFFGSGCGAGARSRRRIEQALAATKASLGADAQADWLGRLYQFANRLAHVYLLRERLRVPAWLVNVCFTDDPHAPTTLAQWQAALPPVHAELGLGEDLPFVSTVFLQAAEGSR
jgi:hypothetical protein